MNLLNFETKVIIACVAFVLLAIIGVTIDHLRDVENHPVYDRFGNEYYSNCCPSILVFGGIIVVLILLIL